MENTHKKKTLKRIFIVLSIIVIALLFIGMIWWYGYIPAPNAALLFPEKPTMLATIPCKSGSPIRNLMVEMTQERALGSIPPGWKQTVAKMAIRRGFPQDIQSCVMTGPTGENAVYMTVIDLGRYMKLARMQEDRVMNKLFDFAPTTRETIKEFSFYQRATPIAAPNYKTINACAIIGSGIVLCSDANYLKQRVEQYNASVESPVSDKQDIDIKIDNQTGYLSNLVKYYETKFEYEIFSTIGKIQSVDVTLQTKDRDTMTGYVLFHTNSPGEEDALVNDVDFFYGVMRRILHPQGIELTGESKREGQDIKLTLELSGFRNALNQVKILAKEGK
jgi:hypothetical protein